MNILENINYAITKIVIVSFASLQQPKCLCFDAFNAGICSHQRLYIARTLTINFRRERHYRSLYPTAVTICYEHCDEILMPIRHFEF